MLDIFGLQTMKKKVRMNKITRYNFAYTFINISNDNNQIFALVHISNETLQLVSP